MYRYFIVWLLSALLLALAGCSKETEQLVLAPPQVIAPDDSCHVCGMVIADFPGPKGQAFLKGDAQAHKFCSTLELFSFLRQPENETQVSHAYVHDSGATDWEMPDDRFFIRAREAWYVIGHDRRGAMNHTLAPFASQAQAQTFCDRHGGEIVRYQDIDLTLLGQLARGELRKTSLNKSGCEPTNYD